jgi:spore germination protein
MQKGNEQIDNLSLFFVVAAIIVETGLLLAPRVLARQAGADAWLAAIIAFIPALTACFFMIRLGQLFPGERFTSYCRKIAGKWLGIVICLMFVSYWTVNNGRILRNFSDLIKTTLLFQTPLEIIMLSFLICAAYLARAGLKSMAKFSVIAVIASVPIGALLLLATYRDWDFGNLLPFMEKGWLKVALTGVFVIGQSEGLESLLFILPFVSQPKKAMPYGLAAISLAQLLMFFVVTTTLLDFGVGEATRLTAPGLSLIQSVELPGRFLERLGSIYLTVWIIIVFPTPAFFLYLPSLVLADTFKLKDYRPLVLLLLPVVYVIAILPPNLLTVFKASEHIQWVNLGFIAILPPLLYLIARLRGFKP